MQLRCLKQRCSGLLLVKAHVLHLFILTLRYESSWEVSVTFLIGQALLMWTVESGIHLQSTEMVNWISTTQLVRVGPSIPEGYGSIPLMFWWEHGSLPLASLFLGLPHHLALELLGRDCLPGVAEGECLRFHLQMSLKPSWGLPIGLFPEASSVEEQPGQCWCRLSDALVELSVEGSSVGDCRYQARKLMKCS